MSVDTIVIIGGGVIGLSTAYQLALKRVGRVVLLDKGLLGDGASSRAAGIGSQLQWSETGVHARQIGFQLFRQFSDEWDDYTFHDEHGCLNLFTPDGWSARATLLPLYDRLGAPYRVLDPQEIRDRWPALNPADGISALHDLQGGYSEPDEYLRALTKRVRDLGVEIREGEPTIGFLRRGERVVGVRTVRQSVDAEAVVSTVHVWSLPVWKELGLQLPMKHFVHQRYLSKPLPQPFVAPPVNADPYLGYIRPAHGNRVLMGIETSDREEYRVGSLDFRMEALSTPTTVRDQGQERMLDFAPILRDVAWDAEHVGLISFTSDGEPILGAVGNLPGLFVAASFHSGGFSYNAVAGLLMAELVVAGRTSIDISAFSPDRFAAVETERHLEMTLRQSQAIRRRH